MSKPIKVPGVRLKYRTFERDEALWVSATIWVDDAPRAEIATLRVDDLGPGSPLYHAWVDATSAIFNARLSAITGLDGFVSRREAPRYKGER